MFADNWLLSDSPIVLMCRSLRRWASSSYLNSCPQDVYKRQGKSYAVVNNFIKQQIEKGFSQYIYDFKYPYLSTIAYNHLLNHPDGYKVKPKFYVINFDDPRRSHRCNPIHPDFMEDITDAYESAYTIMLNLNKTWVWPVKSRNWLLNSDISCMI